METKQVNRNFALDLLRVLACYLVIHQHASEFYYIGDMGLAIKGDNTFRIGILTSIARTSVPLFVMISGYFLLPMKMATADFLKKRFTRILYPFGVWCVLYAVYYVWSRGEGWGQTLQHILHIPVNFGVEVGHLWYIYMLAGLYLLVPVLSPWLKNSTKGELLGYLLLWGLTTLLPYIHLAFPEVWGECFWNQSPGFYYFNGFVGYFVLGYYIKRFGALPVPCSVICFLAGYAITAGVFCMRIDEAVHSWDMELSWDFCCGNVALMALAIFSLFTRITWKGDSALGRVLSDISLNSYGIYLAHIMVLDQFYRLFQPLFPNVLLAVPVITLCSFVTVYVAVKLLSYLPGSKYWLG